jgi:hypothetical protein
VGPLHEHRQALTIWFVLLVAGMFVWLVAVQSTGRVIEAGFWFEDVTFDASEVGTDRLGGPITRPEVDRIKSIAWTELRAAYAGFRIAFSERRNATYRIRVLQELGPSPLAPSSSRAAGESRVILPMGGLGALNFRMLANTAIAYAPPGADRSAMIDGIGRGLGRAAAHEFAHQLLGAKDIHATRDIQSYEYRSADRAEQYYGPIRWDIAAPMLRKRLGDVTASSSR